MPVNRPCDEYSANLDKWVRCRDAIEGEDAIRRGGALYAPMPAGMRNSPGLYQDYLKRASWFGATERTVQGLTGAICRRQPVVAVPEAMEETLKRVTLRGSPFSTFTREKIKEMISIGRVGVLLDRPSDVVNGQPYLQAYKAEQIYHWNYSYYNGQESLDMVVLREEYDAPSKDKFSREKACRYRVLEIIDGVYTQTVWEKQGNEYVPGPTVTPRPAREPIPYIPFVIFGADTLCFEVQQSPILSLVNINLSHWRNSANLEHGRYFTSLPQYYIIGCKVQEEIAVGSPVAWQFEGPKTQIEVGILEYAGAGLGSLERASEEKKSEMAAVGAMLLQPRKREAETAQAKEIEYSGETSILATIADTASQGLTILLRWMAQWEGLPDQDVSVKVNTDFIESKLSPQELTALVSGWQSGLIPTSVAANQLKQGEYLPTDMSVDDFLKEQAKTEAEKQKKQEKAMAALNAPVDQGENRQIPAKMPSTSV
jgi:hypothetical protein